MDKHFESFYLQEIDNQSFKLKKPFDLSYIGKYGKVFKVFDNQDSGNICFGCEKDNEKFFIKFAGAPTINYSGTQEDAIFRLKATVPVYQDLKHPSLVEIIKKTWMINRGYGY